MPKFRSMPSYPTVLRSGYMRRCSPMPRPARVTHSSAGYVPSRPQSVVLALFPSASYPYGGFDRIPDLDLSPTYLTGVACAMRRRDIAGAKANELHSAPIFPTRPPHRQMGYKIRIHNLPCPSPFIMASPCLRHHRRFPNHYFFFPFQVKISGYRLFQGFLTTFTLLPRFVIGKPPFAVKLLLLVPGCINVK
jgi:hypothetical protein